MKKLFLFVALFAPSLCAAQGFRFGSTVTQQGTIGAVTNAVVLPTSPHVNVCIRPANAVPCTNKATTYTDATLGTPCSTSTQIVLDGTTTCVANPDAQDNWGVWLAAGNYDYTITLSTGSNLGPFSFSVGIPPGSTIQPGTVSGPTAYTGNNTHTGTETFANLNKVCYVDGVLNTTVQSCSTFIGSNPGVILVTPGCIGSCLTFPSPWPAGIVIEFMNAPGGTASVPTSTTLGFGGARQFFSSGGTEFPTYANPDTLTPFKVWRRMYTNNSARRYQDAACDIDASIIANDASDASHSLGGANAYNLLSGCLISVIRHDPAATGSLAGISMIVTDDSGNGLSGKGTFGGLIGMESDMNNQSGQNSSAWDDVGNTNGVGDWFVNGLLDITTGAYSGGMGLHVKSNEPVSSSSVQITGNVLTVTVGGGAFGFATGAVVNFQNFVGASFLNGQTVTLTAVNNGASTITANFTHANYGPTADTGTSYNETAGWQRAAVFRDWQQAGVVSRSNNPGSTGWGFNCEDTTGLTACNTIYTEGGNAGTAANVKWTVGMNKLANCLEFGFFDSTLISGASQNRLVLGESGCSSGNIYNVASALTHRFQVNAVDIFKLSATAFFPNTAGVGDLGQAANPIGNLWIGTAATNNFKFAPATTTAARVVSIPDPGTNVNLAFNLTATSAAFATATTAGTCVQSTTAVTGATTSMVATASPVSTPGVGAVWSAFVSSAGNVTINECAVATSAGGTIAFNIRVTP